MELESVRSVRGQENPNTCSPLTPAPNAVELETALSAKEKAEHEQLEVVHKK